MAPTLTIQVLDQKMAICRLAGDDAVPDWCSKGSFVSITRTQDELSLLTPLAKAGIPVIAISTYDTDYLLLKQDQLREAIKLLNQFCHIEKV